MEQRQVFLRDVLTTLFKRMKIILGITVVVFAVVAVGTWFWPRQYESVATVQVLRGRELVADTSALVGDRELITSQLTQTEINNAIELMFSNDVLKATVIELELDKSWPAGAGPLFGVLNAAREGFQNLMVTLNMRGEREDIQEAVERLNENIDVRPIRESFMLAVACRMNTPKDAQRVLEELLNQFRLKHNEIYRSDQSAEFFRKELEERIAPAVEAAQKDLEDFRKGHNIVSIETEKDLLLEEYQIAKRLERQLEESERAAQQLEEGADEGRVTEILSQQTDSTVVTEIQLSLFDKLKERNRLRQSLGPRHPQLIGVNNEVGELIQRLKDAISEVREKTRTQIADLDLRSKELMEVLAENEELQREVDFATENLDTYRLKYEQATISDKMAAAQISSLRTASSPSLPADPASPKPLLNLMLALIGGLIGGIAVAFFFEFLDHGLKTPEDVEYYLKVAPLASFFKSPTEQIDPREVSRLNAMLAATRHDLPVRVLAVASSVRNEGSLPVARALAEHSAEDPDTRTLFVDFVGDGVTESATGTGIVDVLTGTASLDSVIRTMGNLDIIGRGAHTDLPTYLLSGDRMRALMDGLRQRYERVFIHTAPILNTSDAVNIARVVDGVLVVVRSDNTRREVVQRAMDTLADSRDKVIGAVLTDRKQVIPTAVYRRI